AEIDVATFEREHADGTGGHREGNGVATAVWAPPQQPWTVPADLPSQDEYEVLIYDEKRRTRLVAAVEIVSPANKDRPEHRRAFVGKCAAMLRERVAGALVDLVITRPFSLYAAV